MPDYISSDELMRKSTNIFSNQTQRITESESDQSKAKEMYDLVMVLLDNLLVDADKPTINWPNRAEQIDAFKKKLQSILKRKVKHDKSS